MEKLDKPYIIAAKDSYGVSKWVSFSGNKPMFVSDSSIKLVIDNSKLNHIYYSNINTSVGVYVIKAGDFLEIDEQGQIKAILELKSKYDAAYIDKYKYQTVIITVNEYKKIKDQIAMNPDTNITVQLVSFDKPINPVVYNKLLAGNQWLVKTKPEASSLVVNYYANKIYANTYVINLFRKM